MNNKEILPCPCCAGESRLVLDKHGVGFIECIFCSVAITDWSSDVDHLIGVWNTRNGVKHEASHD